MQLWFKNLSVGWKPFKMVNLTDSEIRSLWQNPDFDQAFTGLSIFRDALKTEKNFNISMAKLKDIMNSSTMYLDSLRRRRKFKRRRLEVDGFRQLVQIDLGFPGFEYNG